MLIKGAHGEQQDDKELTQEQHGYLTAYCESGTQEESLRDHYFETQHAPKDFVPRADEPRWQFQISLAPNSEILSRAGVALYQALLPYHLNFKLLKLSSNTPSLGYDPVKDYSKALAENPDSDIDRANRHRVGQEFCVELSYSEIRGAYQYRPDEYKEIMLRCIKALQDEGIEFGSLIAPRGFMNIPCEKGVPPIISYGIFTPSFPSKERHAVLPQNRYNFDDYDNPLENISLTEADFINAGINVEALKVDTERRIAVQRVHFNQAVSDITAELKSICDSPQKIYSTLNPVANEIPLVPEDKHTPYLFPDELRTINTNSELQTRYVQFIEDEKKATINDFESNPFAMAFLKKHFYSDPRYNPESNTGSRIAVLVKNDLKRMQILYLGLVHLEYEHNCLNASSIFIEKNLNPTLKDTAVKLRQWQKNNVPLHKAMETLIAEKAKMDKQSNNTGKDSVYMDIIKFINTALPDDLKLKNFMDDYQLSEGLDDEKRKATLCTQLKALAQKLEGKGPTWGKVLGAVLILGGIFLGGLCVAALIPSLGLSSIPGFTLSTGMVASGAGFFGFTTCVGVGACVYSRDTGLSKTVQTLAAAAA